MHALTGPTPLAARVGSGIRSQAEVVPDPPPPPYELILEDRAMDGQNVALYVYVNRSGGTADRGLAFGPLATSQYTDRLVLVLRPERPATRVEVLS